MTQISKFILGTVQFGLPYGINNPSGKVPREESFRILDLAHKIGITTLDTAEGYGDAQDVLGSYHQKYASRFLINTKFKGTQPQELEAECERSLHTLNVSAIETYFFHRFEDFKSKPGLKTMLNELKRKGLIRKAGLSVYTNAEFEEAINDSDIDTIQLPFNLLDNYYQRGHLMKKAKESGKKIQVRSVFLQGLFFKNPQTLPPFLEPLSPYLNKLTEIKDKNQFNMEELCLAYAASTAEIDEIIIGVDSAEQLQRNADAFKTSLLPEIADLIHHIKVKETELLYPYNWK